MLSLTPVRFLRPRYVKFTPPPLVQQTGDFRCKRCEFWWRSKFVWVTQMTGVCYQGQACERCGHQSKPYFIKEDTVGDDVDREGFPLPTKVGKRLFKKYEHNRVYSTKSMNRGRGN